MIHGISGLPGYLAIFLISFVGASSVLIPIPYVAIVFTLTIAGDLNPLYVALAGGSGSGLGELTGWVIGRFFSKAIENTKYYSRVEALIKFLERRGGVWLPLVIFVFALTPLPDDILFIVLGALRYSLWKALSVSICGKILMMYLVAYSGTAIGSYFEKSGIGIDAVFIGSVIALVAILFIMMFIDWEKILSSKLRVE